MFVPKRYSLLQTSHQEDTQGDFRQNKRNHGEPQARPRERAHTSVNRYRSPTQIFSSPAAHALVICEVCGVLLGVDGGVCVFLSPPAPHSGWQTGGRCPVKESAHVTPQRGPCLYLSLQTKNAQGVLLLLVTRHSEPVCCDEFLFLRK